MTRSKPRSLSVLPLLRPALCLGAVALLSACAGNGGKGLSASQEAADYEHAARRSYSAPGSSGDPWGPYIKEASGLYDVPERWIREVMRVESGGRTEQNGRPITSGAGAMGLMQVMPATYDELRARYGLGGDPYDPHNNILAGTAYIRELYDLYGNPGFLAAYNGGPGRLDDYLTRNRALPEETRRYVAKIGPYIADSFPNKRATSELYAMNSVGTSIPAGPRYPTAPVAAAPAMDTAAVLPPVRSAPIPAAQPVEVAYAPADASPIVADTPIGGWTPAPVAARQDVATYVPPPPPPAPRAQPVQQVASFVPPPLPPVPPPAPAAAPVRMAAAALPVPPPAPAPTIQSVAAYAPRQDASGFRLVSPANAAPAPVFRGGAGQWAIQVGAFGNEGLAHMAAGTARDQAGAAAAGARPLVAGVREAHGTLYRARLTGMSHDAASQACERIRNSRASCIVLSPDAQS